MGIKRLHRGETTNVGLDDYIGIVPDEQIEEILHLAKSLRGMRVVHLNSTGEGGGVAEILRSFTPLMRSVGLEAEWVVIPGDDEFFGTTKRLHNLLQGSVDDITSEMWRGYFYHTQEVASMLRRERKGADAWVMHDPQTLPLAQFMGVGRKAAWVCHIDTSAANPVAVGPLAPFVDVYRRSVFSMSEYVFPTLNRDRVSIAPPAIDAMSPKNRHPGAVAAKATLSALGLDVSRPIMTQVARFDRWKDPLGVIDAYRMVKQDVPTLQLLLVGTIVAKDDPEAVDVLRQVQAYAGNDPDIRISWDPAEVGHEEVAAIQAGSDVVVQKSLREGFGLVVAEAMWKGTPTIGGRCGGIQIQIEDGETGFLVSSAEECADRVRRLLTDADFAHHLGEAGRESVRRNFLLPRLFRDYLMVLHDLEQQAAVTAVSRERIAAFGMERAA